MKKLLLLLIAVVFSIGGTTAQEFKEIVSKSNRDMAVCDRSIRHSVPENPEFTVNFNIDFDSRVMRLEDMIFIFCLVLKDLD